MSVLFAMSRPFYSTEGGGAGGETPPTDDQAPDKSKWTPEQWEAEIGRVAKKERDAAAEATANRLKAEREEEDRKNREAKEHEDAEKRGEYDKVKADLEDKVTKLESDHSAVKSENKVLRDFALKVMQEEIDALPDAIKLFDPGEDAEIGDRVAWLDKAREASTKIAPRDPAGPGARPRPRSEGSSTDQTRQEVSRRRSRVL